MDGANPDSGVNKDFVVGKSSSFTRVSVAEAHSFFDFFFPYDESNSTTAITRTGNLVLTGGRPRGVVERQGQYQRGGSMESDT